MSIELKIKSKHLSEEARIIRFEERKLRARNKTELLASIHLHRVKDVRNENRATFLARAYLKGTSYSLLEKNRKVENEHTFQTKVLPRVLSMVNKYGKTTVMQQLLDWSNDSK